MFAAVGDADHQRRLAVEFADDRIGRIDDARPRPREADEDEAGHDRHEGHAAENLDRGDDMAIDRCRRHHAIADGRQRLQAEEEGVAQGARMHIRDRRPAPRDRQGEKDVDREIER